MSLRDLYVSTPNLDSLFDALIARKSLDHPLRNGVAPDLEGSASDQESASSNDNPNPKDPSRDSSKPRAQDKDKQQLVESDIPPEGPWGNRAVTSRKTGTKRPPEKDSSLNVRINLDLRADVALELHAVLQGDVTVGLF